MFSENQVRQLYVVKSVETLNSKVNLTKSSGDIALRQLALKSGVYGNEFYFQYRGATADSLLRSDLIDKSKVISVDATAAADLAYPLKKCVVKLNSKAVDVDGKPLTGRDYILRISFRNYIGMSDEDQYFKFGIVHTYSGMSASDFYKTLAISLVQNFVREPQSMLKFALVSAGEAGATVETEVSITTKASSLSGTYTGVAISEVEQKWELGLMPVTTVHFTVQPDTVKDASGNEVIWGQGFSEAYPVSATADVSGFAARTSVANSKKTADLEWFLAGEKGDMYRNVGYPHIIPTKYMVDSSNTDGYSYVDIHYFYDGGNENPQKSEKTVTLVGSLANLKTVITGLTTVLTGTNITVNTSKSWE